MKRFALLLVSLALFVSVFNQPTPERPRQALPIPEIHEVYLPGILLFPYSSGPVLGVQNFDPIEVVNLVNVEREKVGSPELRLNPTLMKAAKMRADVILKYENFSHHDPYEQIALTTVLPKLGYNFIYASENIGMDGGGPDTFVTGFMNSSAHRENLLRADLTETGVAMVIGNYKQYYVNIVVQLFAIPAGRDEYLGYNQNDVASYKQALTDIDKDLSPIVWTVKKLVRDSAYSDARHKKLLRQREILSALYDQMRQEKPLENNHVAMIMEYNAALNTN